MAASIPRYLLDCTQSSVEMVGAVRFGELECRNSVHDFSVVEKLFSFNNSIRNIYTSRSSRPIWEFFFFLNFKNI
jgi:hypothetical protein